MALKYHLLNPPHGGLPGGYRREKMRPSQPLWLEFTLIQGEAEVVKKGERAKIPLSTPTLLSAPLITRYKGVFSPAGQLHFSGKHCSSITAACA